MKLYRIDLSFSYWIFAWYILYMLNIVKQSPKLAIVIGILTNIASIIIFIVSKVKPRLIFMFLMNMMITKGFPFLTLLHTKMDVKTELTHFCVLYLIYTIWMALNDTNQYDSVNKMILEFKHDDLTAKWSPGSTLVMDIVRQMKK